MAKDRLDVDEFLKNDLMVENISKTRRILGVFEDELYCYLTEIPANTRALPAFIDEINDEEEIGSIIISEMLDDDIQTLIVKHLTKRNIKFRFVTIFSEKDGAYIVIVGKDDVQRNPIKFETDVPVRYLDNYGKTLCKKHMKEIESVDRYIAEGFRKESFLSKGICPICALERNR